MDSASEDINILGQEQAEDTPEVRPVGFTYMPNIFRQGIAGLFSIRAETAARNSTISEQLEDGDDSNDLRSLFIKEGAELLEKVEEQNKKRATVDVTKHLEDPIRACTTAPPLPTTNCRIFTKYPTSRPIPTTTLQKRSSTSPRGTKDHRGSLRDLH